MFAPICIERENKCVYIYIYIYVVYFSLSLYIYMYIHVCIYIYIWALNGKRNQALPAAGLKRRGRTFATTSDKRSTYTASKLCYKHY